MSTIKRITGKTCSQVRCMSQAEFDNLYDDLEDRNYHAGCAMLRAARAGRTSHVHALEALDDLHQELGHMPMEAIQLRQLIAEGRV